VFKKNGFTFDAGPTVITAPYLIEELFELFNKKAEDYIKLTPLNIWYGLFLKMERYLTIRVMKSKC
jgi:phytoene desaturase